MEPRLERYKNFIVKQYISGLLRNDEYSLEFFNTQLKKKILSGKFEKILFTGMGCSAIVSDIIKGFFVNQKIPIFVEVFNDYDIDFLLNVEDLKKNKTLVIISSYSGYSQEPINAYNKIKRYTKDIIFLTSGGKLAKIAKEEDVSIIRWQINNPDREYPLFHAPQYFCILLDVFYHLEILKTNYKKEIQSAVDFVVRDVNTKKIEEAKRVAKKLKDKEIILVASPKWYLTLLKLIKMHFNEMAMVPAHRNYFHEFGHSEVAVLTDPKLLQAILLFEDKNEDKYTQKKMDNLVKILSEKIPQNSNIVIEKIKIDQNNFFKQFFSTLQFLQYVSYFLGIEYNYKSRELISTVAGNPWYNLKTIKGEKKT
ncbi:MAG: SIS domain-containing protein [Candidatus Magasanikbacteria bacterium]